MRIAILTAALATASAITLVASPASAQRSVARSVVLPPCCTSTSAHDPDLGISSTQIAVCTQTTLKANRLTARAARHLQVGRVISIQGARVPLASGGSVWDSCRTGLMVAAVEVKFQEVEQLDREFKRVTQELDRQEKRLSARIRRADALNRLSIRQLEAWLRVIATTKSR